MLCYLLSGAGARAVYQAGVLEELYQDARFRQPQIFAGTSGGAINAALLAAGRTASAVSLEAEAIVPVLSNALPDPAHAFESLGDALQRLLDLITEHSYSLDRKLLLERNKLADHPEATGGKRYRKIDLYQAIRPVRNAVFDTSSYLDFSGPRLEQMYEEGRARGRAWLTAGAPLDTLTP